MNHVIRTILTIAALIIATSAHAAVMYGFKGLNCKFDQKAFETYAKHHGYKPVTLKSCTGHGEAAEARQRARGTFAVYGYSLGVSGINTAMRQGLRPIEVVTIGGYHKASVSAIAKHPRWQNYPDASSGHAMIGTPHGIGFRCKRGHYDIQREINDRERRKT